MIVLNQNLQGHFFESLKKVNEKSDRPVPPELLYYASEVLGNFAQSKEYFEVSEGKVREKILGIKLMASASADFTKQKSILKDVGDTALTVCGFFSDSINDKIIDTSYYVALGKTAYSRLDSIVPSLLDCPQFYNLISSFFENVTHLIGVMSERSKSQNQYHLFT